MVTRLRLTARRVPQEAAMAATSISTAVGLQHILMTGAMSISTAVTLRVQVVRGMVAMSLLNRVLQELAVILAAYTWVVMFTQRLRQLTHLAARLLHGVKHTRTHS